jgi:hypothetical protein
MSAIAHTIGGNSFRRMARFSPFRAVTVAFVTVALGLAALAVAPLTTVWETFKVSGVSGVRSVAQRGEIDVKDLLVAAVLVAFLIPIAIGLLIAVDTTGWPAQLITVWENLPVIIGVVVLIVFVGYIKLKD